MKRERETRKSNQVIKSGMYIDQIITQKFFRFFAGVTFSSSEFLQVAFRFVEVRSSIP
jgi:hypothetical protein